MKKDKQPTKIALSLSKNYVSHWTWKEAVREILQNALDCDNREVYVFNDGTLEVTTENGAIPRTALLLGESGKVSGNTIGHFGEGLKLALLILCREGYDVQIHNGKELWLPILEHSEDYGMECLQIQIQEAPMGVEDTVKILVLGLDRSKAEEIHDMWIDPETEAKALFEYNGSKVYESSLFAPWEASDDEAVPKAFVGGLYVCDLPDRFRYSYDFHPRLVTLDRDRKTISSWDVKWRCSEIFVGAGEIDKMVELTKSGYKDVEGYTNYHQTYSAGGYTSGNGLTFAEELKTKAAESFRERHGEKAIPVDMDMDKEKARIYSNAISRVGYIPVNVVHAEAEMIHDAIALPDDVVIVEKPDVKKLLSEWVKYHGCVGTHPTEDIMDIIRAIEAYEAFAE